MYLSFALEQVVHSCSLTIMRAIVVSDGVVPCGHFSNDDSPHNVESVGKVVDY
jgi:hypothetical protein